MEECLQTERLVLRPWQKGDLEPFAAMNADPRVMEYFLSTLSREESDAQAERIQAHFDQHGWGFWAVSAPGVSDFIGFVGLKNVSFSAPFTPAVEIGWRLAFEFWGKGYATEGARASLKYGFHTLQLEEIVSFAVVANFRSRRVMEKLHMRHLPKEDFDHPLLPQGHPFQRHALYRIRRKAFLD